MASPAIPESIGKMTALTFLGMSDNRLTGIAFDFTKLLNLKRISFQRNMLSFQLSESIGVLSGLVSVDLSDNKGDSVGGISGTIPQSIGSLVSLTYLSLGRNALSGGKKSFPVFLPLPLSLSPSSSLPTQSLVSQQLCCTPALALALYLAAITAHTNTNRFLRNRLYLTKLKHQLHSV